MIGTKLQTHKMNIIEMYSGNVIVGKKEKPNHGTNQESDILNIKSSPRKNRKKYSFYPIAGEIF